VILVVGVGGIAALVGFFLRGWGLLAAAGFVCFLMYVWDYSPEGIFYALLAGMVASVAVVIGTLTRQCLRS
jgi:hypothetical protein